MQRKLFVGNKDLIGWLSFTGKFSNRLNCHPKRLISRASSNTSNNLTWIEHQLIPERIRPYLYLARVDKPIGTMLLFWPCCWGVAIAAPVGTAPDVLLMGKFLFGAFIMRGAGCTINDLWDQDFDKKVERTKLRPLAAGTIKTRDALTFLSAQLMGGLGVLMTFNEVSILTGFLAMPLVVVYPLMKRVTYFPQFILGLTFNWGVWVGYTAVHNAVNYPLLLPLYASGVCWTLVYDTIYAYQDRKDDINVGVKSLPLFLGDSPQWPLTAISAGMLGGLLYTGYQADLSSFFFIGCLTHIAPHMYKQIWSADLNSNTDLWDKFVSNSKLGGAITAWIAAGHIPLSALINF